MKVALVERKLFGGTCVNTGCMPTKTLVASAYAAHLARRSAEYGIAIEGPIKIDMKRVKARADTVSTNARTNVEKWLRGMDGLTVIEGHARFEGPDVVRVGESLLKAPRIFINVGGRASVPDMPGVGTVDYLTNTSILKLDTVPRHLVVVGGSYIGLEFAQMYRRFGAEVTVVEMAPRLIAREDEDVSEAVREILTDEGIAVRTGATCIGFKPHRGRRGGRRRLHLRGAGRGGFASCSWRWGAAPTRTISGSTGRDRSGRPGLYRRWTTASPPMSPASGPWATATGAEPLPTPPTTTTRSSPPIFSTAKTAG